MGGRREMLDEDDAPAMFLASSGSGQDYALVIGVNDYPKLRPLQGAIADAKAFSDWLIEPEGGRVPRENVRAVFSTSDPLAPIGHEINDALEELLDNAGRTGGRRFYFYFAGHGCVGDMASDISLCMANWSELRRRAALSSEAWLDVLVRSGLFDEIAFFMDCCRVWAVRAVGLPPHIDYARPAPRERATRVFLAYATEFQRPALEVSTGQTAEVRGVFTRVLLAGLRGQAARAGGIVTAASLKDHIEANVPELAKRHRFRQHAEVVNGLPSASRFGFAKSPPRLLISFVDPWDSDVDEVVLHGPNGDVVAQGDPRDGPWELDVPAGNYELRAAKSSWSFDYEREEGMTPERFQIGGKRARMSASRAHTGAFSPGVHLSLRLSFEKLPGPLEAWFPAHATNYISREIAVRTSWLDPIPRVTSSAADIPDAPCRLFVALLDPQKPPWSVRLGAGWSIHGQGVTVKLDRENTWGDGRGSCVFSARMKAGVYVLRWAGKRDIAIRLYPGVTTQIVVDHDGWKPRFESARVFLVLEKDAAQRPPAFGVAEAIESGLGLLGSTPGEPEKLLAVIMAGGSSDDPMLCLLAAHLLAREKTPDSARIEALADHAESLLGPCPDVQALRLHVALLRGADLPQSPWPNAEPPVLREGLLAFVEASHRIPELIPPGSLLERACTERLVDSALSSWPSQTIPETDWLGEAIAEYMKEEKSLDARAIARELGVPTLAVQARFSREEKREESTQGERPDPSFLERRKEAGRLCYAGHYESALALCEAILAEDPEDLGVRHYAEICCQKLERTTLLVPRIAGPSETLERVRGDQNVARVLAAIDGELPIEDLVTFSEVGPIRALRILQSLVADGLVEIRRVISG